MATETPLSSIGSAVDRFVSEPLLFDALDGASGTVACAIPNSPGARPGAMYGVGLPVGEGDGLGVGLGDGLPEGVAVGLGFTTEIKLAPVSSEMLPVDSAVMVGLS